MIEIDMNQTLCIEYRLPKVDSYEYNFVPGFKFYKKDLEK